MKEKIFSYLAAILTFLLIPYLFTMMINGTKTALLTHSVDIEVCIPLMVSQQISDQYELETIKSQTVIARTNLYRKLKEGETFFYVISILKKKMIHTKGFWYIPDKIFLKAAEETKNEILSLNGELKMIPYHAVSAGITRDGSEVFHDENYSYLKSVDSSNDKKSPDYINSTYFGKNQMPEKIEILQRDSAGYIVSLKADGNILEGEAFRKGMGLSSSNFTIQEVGDKIRFLCKGKGHGIGFSQYGGNTLAQSGENYKKILETYFPELKLENISSIFRKE